VVIIGQSGAGKTTIAAVLAERLRFEHIWEDKLAEGHRTDAEVASDIARITTSIGTSTWVFDSRNDIAMAPDVWSKADTILWLDYPIWRIIPQILKPEIPIKELSHFKYVLRKIRRSFFQRRRIRRTFSVEKLRMLAPDAEILRFRTPEQARRWLADETGRDVDKRFLHSYRG
jgi:adenylate kinase family enzyme